jgi:hypothetical protein
MDQTGTYICKICSAGLFSAAERMGASSNTIAFKKPLGDDKIQSRKNKDGQWLVRCAQCHSHLGSAIGGKNPHYRIQTPQVALREAETALLELPAVSLQQEPEEKNAGLSSYIEVADIAMSPAGIFGAGAAVGALLGATVAFLVFRNLETPLSATNIGATTTAIESPLPIPPPPPPSRPSPTPAPAPLPAPAANPATSSDAGTVQENATSNQ